MPFSPTERDGRVVFDIVVATRASRPGIGPIVGDRLKVAVGAAPVEGEANVEIAATLARALGVPKSAVAIVRGTTGRRKTLAVAGVTTAQVLDLAGSER
jgi:uncharacterized protein (TIGR00251 family)